MRALTVLLLGTCFAGSAFAQLAPNVATPPTGAAAAGSTTIPVMLNGKFVVGYDGRGDYLKSEQLEKSPKTPDGKIAANPTPEVISLDGKTRRTAVAVAAPAAAPAQAAASTSSGMHSDSALSGDAVKPRAAAPAPTTTPNTTTASAATTSAPKLPTATAPPVYVGGQLQQPH